MAAGSALSRACAGRRRWRHTWLRAALVLGGAIQAAATWLASADFACWRLQCSAVARSGPRHHTHGQELLAAAPSAGMGAANKVEAAAYACEHADEPHGRTDREQHGASAPCLGVPARRERLEGLHQGAGNVLPGMGGHTGLPCAQLLLHVRCTPARPRLPRPAAASSAALDALQGEVVEPGAVRAGPRRVCVAGPPGVCTPAVQPAQVFGALVADHGGHAGTQRGGQLAHARVAAEGHRERADAARLREGHGHGCQRAVGVDREGGRDLEGLRRVDAHGARAVLAGRPVAGAAPAVAPAAVARGQAGAPGPAVQRRVPGVHVRLLQVDLGAGRPASAGRAAVGVQALGAAGVPLHGRKVEGGVAAAAQA
mmetsp:Transcript_114397/g.369643  ORF Transcript_114397/g.369643 Transcript_114397/m.369643 type:complete len:370 (+) Transcript_114397:381-1490(+)